jgi:hypothetical protein
MAYMIAMLSNGIKDKVAVWLFIACMVFLVYRIGWGMGIRKKLSLVYLKRTILFLMLLLCTGMVTISNDLLIRIIIVCMFLGAVVSFGIPVGKRKVTWLVDDRRDFRDGRNLWEKVVIWLLH